MNQILTILLLLVPVIVFVSLATVLYRRLQRLRRRFAPILDLDEELARLRQALAQATQERDRFVAEHNRLRAQLTEEYQRARATYESLRKELSLLEENLEDISFGLYKPHFSFQTSEEYRAKLESVRDQERQLIRDGRAAVCPIKWTVGGSAREGERMARQNIKLLLRAFNGECDAALAKVSWNNITRMEERIRKSFAAINQLGTVVQVSITQEFLDLKLSELRLTHEYEDKRYREQEEQRRIREQMREEEKAQREFEKAREEAEREEARFEKALEKVRAEAERATGRQLDELNERIRNLQAELEEAHKQKERAISRAQLTQSGYVYIISNIGSFGERILKVGMTRRLEPWDRVRELGDASVPFPFDVHAMLYSEDAPQLESTLHAFLEERRVNLVNPRKEFFNVALDEPEAFAKKKGVSIEFTKLAEAREYRETLAMRLQSEEPVTEERDAFPSVLFSESPGAAVATEDSK